MLVVTLTWTEPTEGSHAILFPDDALKDVADLDEWLQAKWGAEYGETIAKISWEKKRGRPTDEDPWGDLALNVRYSSGEELYEEDCPVLKEHGQERC